MEKRVASKVHPSVTNCVENSFPRGTQTKKLSSTWHRNDKKAFPDAVAVSKDQKAEEEEIHRVE
jgi:hypothetical protein